MMDKPSDTIERVARALDDRKAMTTREAAEIALEVVGYAALVTERDQLAAGLELTVANENGLVSDFAVIADRLRDLAFTLAVGGQEEAAPLNLIARIEWGVEHIQQTEIERLIRLFEGLIEEMSKVPGTTWGAIKTAVRERAIVALEALPHTELVAENARLRATLQQIHDLADGLLNDIEAEEALA